jgi:hypothetical protein
MLGHMGHATLRVSSLPSFAMASTPQQSWTLRWRCGYANPEEEFQNLFCKSFSRSVSVQLGEFNGKYFNHGTVQITEHFCNAFASLARLLRQAFNCVHQILIGPFLAF